MRERWTAGTSEDDARLAVSNDSATEEGRSRECHWAAWRTERRHASALRNERGGAPSGHDS